MTTATTVIPPSSALPQQQHEGEHQQQQKHQFRQYNESSSSSFDLTDAVARLYHENHTKQTWKHAITQLTMLKNRLYGSSSQSSSFTSPFLLENVVEEAGGKNESEKAFVEEKSEKSEKAFEMSLWTAMKQLDGLVDESDPDTSHAQTQHAFQSAEAARKMFPLDTALHFTCLIHDLGKVLCFHPQQTLNQWSVVGDTFILGMPFSSKIVHSQFFSENPDFYNKKFMAAVDGLGVYTGREGIGFDNCIFSFGHDEYLYHVLKANGTTLPERYLRMIRYHSFYPWHNARDESYERLADERDRSELLNDVLMFNQFDLYSKTDELVDIEAVRPYYEQLARQYLPNEMMKW